MLDFQKGQFYNRAKDIHDRYGGSRRSGIAPCAHHPLIFVFTGSLGEQYGYTDALDENGIYHYTGEGQVGDMTLTKGNKALAEHQQNGKAILLFKKTKKGMDYQYLGEHVCTSYEFNQIPDKNGDLRQGIVFHFLNVDDEDVIEDDAPAPKSSLEELRKRAYEAAAPSQKMTSKEGKRSYYKRSQEVKDYVLERAQGVCECCGEPAPFLKRNGSPYLEPHHIYKLSDHGCDSPDMVAALTPNCHRRIHHSVEGKKIDHMLKDKIFKLEKAKCKI